MSEILLTLLLESEATALPCASVAQWWNQHRGLAADWPSPIQRAIAAGFRADRVGWAFASAYQVALRVLVPDLPEPALAALCVTEDQGTAPRAMRSGIREDGLGGLLLDGAKRWTTLGPEGGLFLVAARDTRQVGDRPVIRLLRVPSDTAGVQVQPMPPTAFVPEVPHAQLRFESVRLEASAILPGDGYADYVKPFRTIEDLHVHAAVLAYLVRESRRLAWPHDWTEQALAVLLAYTAVAGLDPRFPTTHVALAGALNSGERLAAAADALWASSPDTAAAARWRRDRKLLSVASQARTARIQNAWDQFN